MEEQHNGERTLTFRIQQPIISELRYITGYSVDTFYYLLQKYGGQLQLPHRVFIDVYIFIHMYDRYRQAPITFGKSKKYIIKLLKAMTLMANTFNEIHWEHRLNPWNHTTHFPFYVNSIVDTLPIPVSQPKDFQVAKLLYNPKYGRCVYKVLICIDFLGRILFFSGPYIGTKYDGHIWLETVHLRPRLPGEFTLGDGHFITCPDVITQYTHSKGELFLPVEQEIYSAVHQHYRARVEHINGVFVVHQMFSSRFQGSLQTLVDALYVTAHTLNVVLNQEIRYQPIGPWSHFP
jgi:hypothetical protein